MRSNSKKLPFLIVLCYLAFTSPAFNQDYSQLALDFAKDHVAHWGLVAEDVSECKINDSYRTPHNGAAHTYLKQRYAGVEVYNAIIGIHMDSKGEVFYTTSSFVSDIGSKVNTLYPSQSPEQALEVVLDDLGLEAPGTLRPSLKQGDQFSFELPELASSPVLIKPVYQPMQNDVAARLSWDVTIDLLNGADHWSIRVDAVTGQILDKKNYTVYCHFPGGSADLHHQHCREDVVFTPNRLFTHGLTKPIVPTSDGATYNVFAIPIESPIHGERSLVVDPSDPDASPFGWHDTNGQVGAEHTITRGNNVHAFLDLSGLDASQSDEPDAGASLLFDFPFDPDAEPEANRDAAVVQLFYMNNIMHDFAYHHGFNEEAGNFQQNTYQRGGTGGDAVQAHAQDGIGKNNANFSTPPDGRSGVMQMFLWDIGGTGLLEVLEPTDVATRFETQSTTYGPSVTSTAIEGMIVEAFDNSVNPSLACEPIFNREEVRGNIAMIDRGECFFEQKTLNVEEAGAIAVIICRPEGIQIGDELSGRPELSDPRIPTIVVKEPDCQRIRLFLKSGVRARIQRPVISGPSELDATFDNGIIAHEYGHGISLRLTGGPSDPSCLFNDEQMGEGWSDFFALVMTSRPDSDNGRVAKGIGNYVIRGGVNGRGIRRVPYSTDLQINNQDYDDIINTFGPHSLGEIWAATLWDLYWKFIETYGWDEDIYTGNGGNNKAVRLVIDAMKLQKCNPGFVEGRNAIIAADIINFGGENECLIWDVFARRGIGWSADEGGSFSRNDGVPGFDIRPDCAKDLQVSKSVTELIEAGEEITVELIINNFKDEMVSGVVVSDEIPVGSQFIAGSVFSVANPNVTIQDDEVSFEIPEIAAGTNVRITYRLATNPEVKSIRRFIDDVEGAPDNWEVIDLDSRGPETWEIASGLSNSGDKHWFIQTSAFNNDKALQSRQPMLIGGEQPVLRFFQKYITEPKNDGGIVQVSSDGGNTWQEVDDLIFRNPYRGEMTFSTFAISNIKGFWGRKNNFIASFIDLAPFKGEEILIRFRFGTIRDANEEGEGWFLDDIEIMDMANYLSEVCVNSEQGDRNCALPEGKGTVVESGSVVTSLRETLLGERFRMMVFPNPVNTSILNLDLFGATNEEVRIELFDASGRLIRQEVITMIGGSQLEVFELNELPAGFYILNGRTSKSLVSAREKIVVLGDDQR